MTTELTNESRRGFPTAHKVRFRSERWIVEGGIQREHAKDIREYEGRLFDSYHMTSHLCVCVSREEGWYRSEAWHGFVGRDNVIAISFIDGDSTPATQQQIAESIGPVFTTYWQHLFA